MRFVRLCLIALLASLSAAAFAQSKTAHSMATTPAIEVGASYSFFHANVPPASCGCFSLNGGHGTFVYHLNPAWALVSDVSGAYANNVSGTTQNITTYDYFFGPRYSLHPLGRFTPYGEVLIGGAKELSNYAYVQNVNAFGLSAGGGLNTPLGHHLGWNVVEADWIYTHLPNGVNTHQNLLRISTGITFRFGSR
jgi:outer membrane immunogenic protein